MLVAIVLVGRERIEEWGRVTRAFIMRLGARMFARPTAAPDRP